MDIRFTSWSYSVRHDYCELLPSGAGYCFQKYHVRISERVHVVSGRGYQNVQDKTLSEFKRQRDTWELYHDNAEDFLKSEDIDTI